MKVRELIRRIREGPIINDRPPTRGNIPPPTSDFGPGKPTATVRKDTLPNVAQGNVDPATSSQQLSPIATTGQQLSPDTIWMRPGDVRLQTGPTGRPYAIGGRTPTQTPGFGKLSPSGTGLTDQPTGKGATYTPVEPRPPLSPDGVWMKPGRVKGGTVTGERREE